MMGMMIKQFAYRRCICFILILLYTIGSSAQSDTAFVKKSITLDAYLNLVGGQNLAYLAEQYNIGIAEAGIESARVFPDPELNAGVYDNQAIPSAFGTGL